MTASLIPGRRRRRRSRFVRLSTSRRTRAPSSTRPAPRLGRAPLVGSPLARARSYRTTRLEISGTPSYKRLAVSMHAPETRLGYLQTLRRCDTRGSGRRATRGSGRTRSPPSRLPATCARPAAPPQRVSTDGSFSSLEQCSALSNGLGQPGPGLNRSKTPLVCAGR